MTAAQLLDRRGDVIDGHRWDDLAPLLHPDLVVRYVHTGEVLDRDAFVRVNAEYPGFERFGWEEIVDAGERAVGRGVVTGRNNGEEERFGVATFATARDDLITEITEVWTDIGTAPPADRRPS